MDRVEKKLTWATLILNRPLRQAQGRLCGTDRDMPDRGLVFSERCPDRPREKSQFGQDWLREVQDVNSHHDPAPPGCPGFHCERRRHRPDTFRLSAGTELVIAVPAYR
jgi:hypothetical protein